MKVLVRFAIFVLCAFGTASFFAQTQDDEVIRVSTELVQTDVMVFDKNGRFVKGLQPSQFILRVDGQSVPIQFFESVTAGSSQEAKAFTQREGPIAPTTKTVSLPDRGRAIFFFVDDLHMELSDIGQTRKMLLDFIEKQLGPNDQMAIASASGSIGFLQQLTDNTSVLRAAIRRLTPRPYRTRDADSPPMSEYQAFAVNNYDPDLTNYFVEQFLRQNPGTRRDSAVSYVQARASNILQQARTATAHTLSGLEGLVRSAAPLPGRKLVFFISGGFIMDRNNSDDGEKLRRVTGAAARSGAVIYSLDARGLTTNTTDISDGAADPVGVLYRSGNSDNYARQDGMFTLAADTGGRAIFNTNGFAAPVAKAVQETAVYYLLAWQPVTEEQKGNKFRRLEISVQGRPDLTVRVRRGYLDEDITPSTSPVKDKKPIPPADVPAAELNRAIGSLYPQRTLPVFLSANHMEQTEAGDNVLAVLQVNGADLSYPANAENVPQGALIVRGLVYDDQGKIVGPGFQAQIGVKAPAANKGEAILPPVDYVYNLRLKPGLYQVRVAARDTHNGRVGSAIQWLEIPDLSTKKPALSSIMLAAPTSFSSTSKAAGFSISQRFSRKAPLRFLVYLYNLAPGSDGRPDVSLQVDILRDGQTVLGPLPLSLDLNGVTDMTRLPFAAELALESLRPGRYRLQVSITDKIAQTNAIQTASIEVY